MAKRKMGTVYLVGAGPGDPDLLTVKGQKLIKKADVIVYDFLASEKILNLSKKRAEIIYVGKQSSNHTLRQSKINELLVEKAKKGKEVVRLKGGDPFVFGRGGEEALFLVKHKVSYEIVPGITSAIAAPAYAGIPVTHRKYASSVIFVTGHSATPRTEVRIDWKALARNTGTLVFLMGVHNLPEIVTKLLKHGKPTRTPVALVQWGTHAKQRTLVGSLANIVDRVKKAKLEPPAVIVVGDVVRLRKKLAWFE